MGDEALPGGAGRQPLCDHGRLWSAAVRVTPTPSHAASADADTHTLSFEWWQPSDGRAARLRRQMASVPPEHVVRLARDLSAKSAGPAASDTARLVGSTARVVLLSSALEISELTQRVAMVTEVQAESGDGDLEADVALLVAASKHAVHPPLSATIDPAMKEAGRRVTESVGDARTVLPPGALQWWLESGLSSSLLPLGAPTQLGTLIQTAAAAAEQASRELAPRSGKKGSRRPEAPHGCVLVRDGTVLAVGVNHTVASLDAIDPQLRPHLDGLHNLIGDHRQWQRGYESQRDGRPVHASEDRVSFHAEQHAVLLAVASGHTLAGCDAYIVEVGADGILGESYPCSVCLPLLVRHSIRRVFFTTATGVRRMDLGAAAPRDPEVMLSDDAALAKCTHVGVVKPEALRKYGFIAAKDPELGDVFFPMRALHLVEPHRTDHTLRRFPDGTPCLSQPFRAFLAGRRVQFCIGPAADSSDGTRRRPQASLVVPLPDD